MNRLTKKNDVGYFPAFEHETKGNYYDLIHKLGQLEDIEEENGIELTTLFKVLKDGFYIKYNDKLSTGDKIVYYSANKGTIKYIIPNSKEPYTDFRPNEHIESFMSLSSISGRMTFSIAIFVIGLFIFSISSWF